MATAVATVEAGKASGQKKIVAAKKQVGQPQTPGLAMQLATAGIAACIADMITFPLDTTKVRLQVQGELSIKGEAASQPRGVLGTLVSIVRNEGATALYSGIVPGLQRQMAFSAIRIGAYEPVKRVYVDNSGQTSGLPSWDVELLLALQQEHLQSWWLNPLMWSRYGCRLLAVRRCTRGCGTPTRRSAEMRE